MSLAQPVPERRPSPLNLSSNNPFRNRAASPQSLPSPALSTPASFQARSQSRNPFLATFEQDQLPPQPDFSQLQRHGDMASDSQQPSYGKAAEELFSEMSLNDKSAAATTTNAAAFPRPPVQRSGTAPHRPPRPDEDEMRRKGSASRPAPRRPPPREELDIFASPERRENRRPRRNSESSVMDKRSIDEERKRRERRHRERREREKDKEAARKADPKVKRPKGLDLIDKLDVSGIYGPSMFHHDGPFDACNPHRNRKRDQRAPMHAFPEGSANNAMGGSGPVNSKMNLDQFHGRGAEGFTDFSATNKAELEPVPKPMQGTPGFYNPKANIEFIHGDESTGLGTSTFLEGAPASKKDLERHEQEADQNMLNGGGLARKKSLAQRIRGISQPRRDYAGRMASPEAQYEYRRAPPPPPNMNGRASPAAAQSAGGNLKMYEKNPFFDDYDDMPEKKGASVRIAEPQKPGARGRAPSSPINGLERSLTAGSAGPADPEPKASGGFLNRVKSLKGGRRPPRPERRPS